MATDAAAAAGDDYMRIMMIFFSLSGK